MAKKTGKDSARASGTGKPNTSSQNTLVQLAVSGSLLGLIATVACFALLGLWRLPADETNLLKHASERQARVQAATLELTLERLELRLAQAAEPELVQALEERDGPRLQQWQERLQRQFPQALSVRLLPLGPLGIAGLRRAEAGLRNNIEIDLLRRASNGETAGPEAYRHDGSWLISLAHPIPSPRGEHHAGAIFITFADDYFTPLARLAAGQVSLVQDVSREEQVIARTGNGDFPAHSHELPLSIENWRLQFTPSRQLAAETRTDRTLLWALTAVSAAAILAGALLTAHLFRRALQRNLSALVGGDSTSLTLPGFPTLRAQLAKRLASARASQSSAPKPPPPEAEKPARAPAPAAPPEDAQTPSPAREPAPPPKLPEHIFRAYDIRGRADSELTDAIAYQLGLAIGSEALDRGQQGIVVGRDGRASSPVLAEALIRGLRDSGRDVIDVGMVPTPVLYFATHLLDTQSGVMVTGSHNPADYNGFKITLAGRPLAGTAIQALRERIEGGQLASGQGHYETSDVSTDYIERIASDVAVAHPLKIVLDAGNGVAGAIAPALFEALGCEVIPLFCDVDSSFPNHHPDPTVEANLEALIQTVAEHQADLGLAFDGDGDRLGAVTGSGAVVAADRLLMLLAQDVVARNPGADVIFDVKCSRHLNTVISQFGGRPIMWKSGHSFMKEKMLETGALLGGEFSGHIYFSERWYGFDDALYAGARLVEILSTSDPSLDNQLAALPAATATPELRLPVAEASQFELMERLVADASFEGGKVTTLDGVRVDFPDGWGLVRASNTEAALILRFEGDDEQSLNRIRDLFRTQLSGIDPQLATGF